MRIVDLRSDTVTKPSPEMRKAMAEAEVGDDVFGEDPTVNLLQERVAELLGKEAALFVASGTMANQVAIRAHTEPGDEVVLESDSHVCNYESAAPAALSGVQLRMLSGRYGVITAEQIESAIRPAGVHYPRTSLVWIENTHNRAGGTVFPLGEIARIGELCRREGLKFHMDGARLLNASVASGVSPGEFASPVDSTSICLSKGLGCPVGSVLAGSSDFIERAKRFRKMFGGGMRQVGILAAAGLYALEHNVDRLADDHANARRLAEAIAGLPGVGVDLEAVQTNIVIIDVSGSKLTAPEAQELLKSEGVLVLPRDMRTLRAVTHLDVSREDIEHAIKCFRKVFGGPI